MERTLIVGSGASAVHFALSLLEKGLDVTMVDVGRSRPDPVRPQDSFQKLKESLDDPVAYFLGSDFETITYPGAAGEYYGFPPHKRYIFAGVTPFTQDARGFAPLYSFAQGGLAEAWTAGAYPFNREEMAEAPFPWEDLQRHYGIVARRIGIFGEEDDLADFLPLHDHLMEPLELDEHSQLLLQAYRNRRQSLNRLGAYLGRSRVATLSRDLGERQACSYLGRCLTGCPTDSLYTPLATLRQCRKFDGFRYLSGLYVTHFRFDAQRRITAVVTVPAAGGPPQEIAAERVVLGAGTLSTSRIVMESIYRDSGDIVRLPGLMDNRQVLMPFLNRRMVRRPYDPDTYQYAQLLIGVAGATPREYVHGIVTTLKTASIHPIVQNVPFDMKTSLYLFRHVHAALGLVNINLCDTRRESNHLSLERPAYGSRHVGSAAGEADGGPADEAPLRLLVHYEPPAGEDGKLQATIRTFKRVLGKLGCTVPPGMVHVRPMGASVHYAGTLPMSAASGTFTVSAGCRSHDFPNLWVIDGSVFPFLPAKNLTFTLMANATRVAEAAF